MKKVISLINLFFISLVVSANGDLRNGDLKNNVLQHFKNAGALKYQAVLYLLDNMDVHFSYESKDITSYYNTMDSLFRLPRQKDDTYKQTYLEASTKNGDIIGQAKKTWDKDVWTEKQLISYIDEAFKVWNMPWNKDVDFKMFRNYVLPYRITTEPISNWRNEYYNKYKNTIDKLLGSQTNNTYKYGLYGELNKGFYGALYYPESPLPELPLNILMNMKLGNCESNAKRNIAQLRTMGIPAALDFVPQWGNRSLGHSWAVMFTGDESHFIPFGLNEPLGIHFYFRPDHKLPKVYRHTFDKQPEMAEFASDTVNTVPEYLHDWCIKDVTDMYTEVSSVTVDLIGSNKDNNWVYLCVFDNKDWIPVCFTKRCFTKRNQTSATDKAGKAIFDKVGRGVVYLPLSINGHGEFVVEGYPFVAGMDGTIKTLKPDLSRTQTIRVVRKYTFTSDLKEFCRNTIGGKFQVANNEDFSDSLTIATIRSTDESRYYSINIKASAAYSNKNNGRYKYFRYLAPNGSFGNIAEIEVYDAKGLKAVPAKMFGMRGAIKNHNLEKAFDGDPLTSYALPFADGGCAAAEFKEPTTVSEIRYLPRNDGNFIEEGDHYVLYYWNENDWKLIEEKTGTRDGVLNFNEVPSNALFLLRDLTKGSQERIFTYENGRQIWW